MKSPSTQEETLQKIVEILKNPFYEKGFVIKRKRFFEKEEKSTGNIDQYEISLSKAKGYFSLHLILSVINKKAMHEFNQVLKKALLDDEYSYPQNWSKKNIDESVNSATSDSKVISLTDWKQLKSPNESLKEFSTRFSIWLCVFDHIEEITNWKNQLLLSVDLSVKWFEKAHNPEYVIEATDLKGLYFLKQSRDLKRLDKKYKEILAYQEKNKIDTNKLKLYFKHLLNAESSQFL